MESVPVADPFHLPPEFHKGAQLLLHNSLVKATFPLTLIVLLALLVCYSTTLPLGLLCRAQIMSMVGPEPDHQAPGHNLLPGWSSHTQQHEGTMNLKEATQLVRTADIVCDLSDECEPLFPIQYADKEPPIQVQCLYVAVNILLSETMAVK